MITQLGDHRGKQLVFGHDRHLDAELPAYLEVLRGHGLRARALERKTPYYLTTAARVCRRVQGRVDRVGVLVCLTGIGMSIAANKFRGIYAARCLSVDDAASSRVINNANVLCLAAQSGLALNQLILDTFMGTPYEGRRLEQLAAITLLEVETQVPLVPVIRGKADSAKIA
jgi:RpiB/LacA/LacB family sugar-phosphate isomerase